MPRANHKTKKDVKKDKREAEEVDEVIDIDGEGEEEDGEEEYEDESEDLPQGPSFVSQIKLRTNRGNKVDKLLKNEKLAHDSFWVENDYFGSKLGWFQEVDELSDDSEEYDFERELGGKNESELDSFDEDFGEYSNEAGEEEENEGSIDNEDWHKIADESKAKVLFKKGKSKLHKKKGVV